MNSGKLIGFVNRIATDAGLRAELEAGFEATVAREGFNAAEAEALRSSWTVLRGASPTVLEARLAAGGKGC